MLVGCGSGCQATVDIVESVNCLGHLKDRELVEYLRRCRGRVTMDGGL